MEQRRYDSPLTNKEGDISLFKDYSIMDMVWKPVKVRKTGIFHKQI